MADAISVAIVGLGSRGLSVLERIVTLANRAGPAAGRVRVEIIDPACTGAGVHATDQPDYLLLNTTSSQVSMFPDSHTVGDAVGAAGPSLYDWVVERGLRVAEDGFSVGRHGRPVRPTDFLPRRILGEYLGWFLDHVLSQAADHIEIRLHRADAIDIQTEPAGELTIVLSDASLVQTRYAFLTTGYTPNHERGIGSDTGNDRYITDPYQVLRRLDEVAPADTVAIGGFGLSAIDLMSCFTVGRGGHYVGSGGQRQYVASGHEPTLLMFSRSGLPCRARPLVVRFESKYQPLVFTEAAIDALRVAQGGPLDFDRDVLPLIHTEMRVAYRRCQARLAGEEALGEELAAAAGLAEITAVLNGLDQRWGGFDAAAILEGSAGMLLDDSAAYQKWLTDVVSEDLAEGLLGFTGSPVKAALDVLRDLRDTFRYVVDFGGLTADSLDRFTRHSVPMINRAVVGPQYERHVELLALMAAGIVQVPFGPAPTVRWSDHTGHWTISSSQLALPYSSQADWLIAGNLGLPTVETSASPLLQALHAKGMIRRHSPGSRDVPGVDVNADQHPINVRGVADGRVWVLGPLCEGATFYNNLVPSPNAFSRPAYDAHRCVAAMFAASTST